MKRKTKIITLAEIAIFAAIGFVLDLLASLYSGFFPFGGSVSFALVTVVIISFRRGVIPGVFCGLLIGLLDLTDGFYTIADTWYNSIFQIGMDYIFTYMLVGIVGLFKPLFKRFNKVVIITLSTVFAGLLKYFMHFLSGILYWPEYENQPFVERVVYSLAYNGGYMIPTIIVCAIASFFLCIRLEKIFMVEENE